MTFPAQSTHKSHTEKECSAIKRHFIHVLNSKTMYIQCYFNFSTCFSVGWCICICVRFIEILCEFNAVFFCYLWLWRRSTRTSGPLAANGSATPTTIKSHKSGEILWRIPDCAKNGWATAGKQCTLQHSPNGCHFFFAPVLSLQSQRSVLTLFTGWPNCWRPHPTMYTIDIESQRKIEYMYEAGVPSFTTDGKKGKLLNAAWRILFFFPSTIPFL